MIKKDQRIRALVLFSGGLDSILAIKILQLQQIDVTGLTFVSYFFNNQTAVKQAQKLKIKIITEDFSEEHVLEKEIGREFGPSGDIISRIHPGKTSSHSGEFIQVARMRRKFS